MSAIYANNASTHLTEDISPTSTTLVVTSTTGFPVLTNGFDYATLTIQDDDGNTEITHCTGVVGNTFTVSRGQEGTPAIAFSAGALVENRITAEALNELVLRGVGAPTVISPANNTSSTALSTIPIEISKFFMQGGLEDTSAGTEIIIYTTDRTNPVFKYAGEYTTEVLVDTVLTINTRYYVQARHKGATFGWSPWSQPNTFVTPSTYVKKPRVLYPGNESTIYDTTPTITWSQFETMPGVADVYTAYTIELAVDENFLSIYIAAFTKSPNYYFAIMDGQAKILVRGTTYYARVKVHGAKYASEWSDTVKFTVGEQGISTPQIVSPQTGVTDLPWRPDLNFTLSPFQSSFPEETATNVHIALGYSSGSANMKNFYTSYDGVNYTITPALAANENGKKIYAKCRYEGSMSGWSDWSKEINATLFRHGIINVGLAEPSNEETGVSTMPEFKYKPFQSTDPADTPHFNLNVLKLRKESSPESAVDVSLVGSYDNVFYLPANTYLDTSTTYYATPTRASTMYTQPIITGTVSKFTTTSARTLVPTLVSDFANFQHMSHTPTYEVSDPVCLNETCEAMQIRIFTGNTFELSSDKFDSGEIPWSKFYTVTTPLTRGIAYKTTLRYKGSVSGWTRWSVLTTAGQFKTAALMVGDISYITQHPYTAGIHGATYGVCIVGGGGGAYNIAGASCYAGGSGASYGSQNDATDLCCGGGGSGYVSYGTYTNPVNSYASIAISGGAGGSKGTAAANATAGGSMSASYSTLLSLVAAGGNPGFWYHPDKPEHKGQGGAGGSGGGGASHATKAGGAGGNGQRTGNTGGAAGADGKYTNPIFGNPLLEYHMSLFPKMKEALILNAEQTEGAAGIKGSVGAGATGGSGGGGGGGGITGGVNGGGGGTGGKGIKPFVVVLALRDELAPTLP